MFCKNCGKELKEGARFCNICGTCLISEENNKQEDTQRYTLDNESKAIPDKNNKESNYNEEQIKKQNDKSTGFILIFAIIGILIIGMLIFMAIKYSDYSYYDDTSDYNENSEEVLFIKNANFKGYPSSEGYSSIGDAFENYFKNITWEYFVSDDNCDVVEFNGTHEYDGSVIDYRIQFLLNDDDTFDIYFISCDNNSLNESEKKELIRDIIINSKNTENNKDEETDDNKDEDEENNLYEKIDTHRNENMDNELNGEYEI